VWKKYFNGLGDIFILHMDKNTIAHTKSSEHDTPLRGKRGHHFFGMFLKES